MGKKKTPKMEPDALSRKKRVINVNVYTSPEGSTRKAIDAISEQTRRSQQLECQHGQTHD